MVVHYRFDHQFRPIAIHLRRRKVNQAELKPLLQTNDVLCTYGIGVPERLVEIFSIPSAELGGTMIHIVKWSQALSHALDLAELSHIAPGIERLTYVGGRGKRELIRLMRYVAGNYVVPSSPKIGDQPYPDRRQPSSY